MNGYPTACSLCSDRLILIRGCRPIPKLEAKPYVGSRRKVFLVGQDPTLSTRRINTVFEFDRKDSQLRRYIEENILTPLGVVPDDVYATNAVKCTFPNLQTPARWAKALNIRVEAFLQLFFSQCKKYLTREFVSIKPRIVFAFGQPTHRLLISAYHWEISPDMKEVFGQVFPVHNPISTLYVPVIHYNSRQHRYYQTRWPAFLEEVREHLTRSFQKRAGMAALKSLPKRSESIMVALGEVAEAVRILKAKREDVRGNEIFRECPDENRVKRYEEQIMHLGKVLQYLDDAMAEMSNYP